jgi:hypothetical protein
MAAWAWWVLLSHPSRADTKAASESDSGPSAAAPASARSTSQRAAAAFQASLDAYAKGDLKGALTAMRESYQLSGHTELLYNIARIEAELGACSEALANFNQYITQVPDGRYRAQAESASAELSERCPSPAAPPTMESAPLAATPTSTPPAVDGAPKPAASPPEPESWRPPEELGWTAIALGVAGGASAVYFTARAVDARDQLRHQIERQVKDGGPPANLGLRDEQRRAQTTAQVLAVSGGALAVGGIVVLLMASQERPRAIARTTFSWAPGSFGACYTQPF